MLALTLQTTVETFILAFVTATAVVSVAAIVRLFKRMRSADTSVSKLSRWARRVGRKIDVPYEEEDQ